MATLLVVMDVHEAFLVETEARPRRFKFQPKRDRAAALLRLETASRSRRQDRGHIPASCEMRSLGLLAVAAAEPAAQAADVRLSSMYDMFPWHSLLAAIVM